MFKTMIDLVFKTKIITNIIFHRYNQNTNLNVHTYYLTIGEKAKQGVITIGFSDNKSNLRRILSLISLLPLVLLFSIVLVLSSIVFLVFSLVLVWIQGSERHPASWRVRSPVVTATFATMLLTQQIWIVSPQNV